MDEGEVQNRSYPNSVGRHQGTEGWEFVERYDLAGNAQRVAEEASALLRAKTHGAGHDDGDPRWQPGRAADPRVLRPPDRAGPRARHGGGVRRARAS